MSRLLEFFLSEIDVDDRSSDPRHFTHAGKNYRVEEGDFYWALYDSADRELDGDQVRAIPGLEAAYASATQAAEDANLGSQEEWDDSTRDMGNAIIGTAAKRGY
jgi:hypothetical protein